MTVSVIIPTFNRERELLDQLVKIDVVDAAGIKIEIFDDNSKYSYKKISAHDFLHLDVNVCRNRKNLGFAKNLMHAIRASCSDYVVLMADDDELLVGNVGIAFEYIRDTNADFACPISYVSGVQYRGTKRQRHIMPHEFMRASSRAPGLIFRTSKAKEYIGYILERIDSGCSFCCFYPQTALLLCMLANHDNCIHIPVVLDRIGFNRPTGLKTSSGAVFWSFEARAKQLSDLCTLIDDIFPHEDRDVMLNAANMSYVPRFVGVMLYKDQFAVLWSAARSAIWRAMMSQLNATLKEKIRLLLRYIGR